MIKCHLDRVKKRFKSKLKTKGTVEDILVELITMIRILYRDFRMENPEAARVFKLYLTEALNDPDSVVWEEEDHEK